MKIQHPEWTLTNVVFVTVLTIAYVITVAAFMLPAYVRLWPH
jgi:hypothetical protein